MSYSIEGWAKKFLSIYHPKSELKFEKAVVKIEFTECFTLKVFNDEGMITDYYFVCPEDAKISKDSQPFHSKISKYFTKALDGEIPKLWIGYIVVDKTGTPVEAQRFSVDPKAIE